MFLLGEWKLGNISRVQNHPVSVMRLLAIMFYTCSSSKKLRHQKLSEKQGFFSDHVKNCADLENFEVVPLRSVVSPAEVETGL